MKTKSILATRSQAAAVLWPTGNFSRWVSCASPTWDLGLERETDAPLRDGRCVNVKQNAVFYRATSLRNLCLPQPKQCYFYCGSLTTRVQLKQVGWEAGSEQDDVMQQFLQKLLR